MVAGNCQQDIIRYVNSRGWIRIRTFKNPDPADKKIAVLKVVRSLTGLGLKEAKELVESAPKQIQEVIAKDAAEDAKKQIEDAGGKASLK